MHGKCLESLENISIDSQHHLRIYISHQSLTKPISQPPTCSRMKKTIYSVALGLAGLALTASPTMAQDQQRISRRSCGSMDVLAAQIAADPARAQALQAIDNQALRYAARSEEHTSELQSHLNLVCRLLLEKK